MKNRGYSSQLLLMIQKIRRSPVGIENIPCFIRISEPTSFHQHLCDRWWLNQPIWKICSSNWIISSGIGMNIKNIWNQQNHHLDVIVYQRVILLSTAGSPHFSSNFCLRVGSPLWPWLRIFCATTSWCFVQMSFFVGWVMNKTLVLLFNTVDGWNPAPPGMYETLWIMGKTTYQLVQDFSHQQYLVHILRPPLSHPVPEWCRTSKVVLLLLSSVSPCTILALLSLTRN